eukprot:TRINITY_DN33971_c0_g1_i1.p1 TRINITY_DN33971_c0_g1~~TRINITY_DN33971_c0_g1_i1.p1  ORF type:complete len:617 (+),score=69.52 TRINITY_DN33971_c0_g1_i1:65-1915(+)
MPASNSVNKTPSSKTGLSRSADQVRSVALSGSGVVHSVHWSSRLDTREGSELRDRSAEAPQNGEQLKNCLMDKEQPTSRHNKIARPVVKQSLELLLNGIHTRLGELGEKNILMERNLSSQLQVIEHQMQHIISLSMDSGVGRRRGHVTMCSPNGQRKEDGIDLRRSGDLHLPCTRVVGGRDIEEPPPTPPNFPEPGTTDATDPQWMEEFREDDTVIPEWSEYSKAAARRQYRRSRCESIVANGTSTPRALAMDIIPALVIVVNAVVFGLSTDLYRHSRMWTICECAFTVFFVGEIVLKLRSLGVRSFLCGQEKWWSLFDTFCVIVACVDLAFALQDPTSSFTFIKLIRMAKLLRLVRVLRFPVFVELKKFVTGLFCGLKVLLWAKVLLALIIYIGGIVMTNLVGDDQDEFKTLSSSMFTLFRCFTDGCTTSNGAPLHELLRKEYGFAIWLGWILSYILVSIGIFNLITSLFIEHVFESQSVRRRLELGESATHIHAQIREQMLDFCRLDAEKGKNGGTELIDRATFNEWLSRKTTVDLLSIADVDLASKFEIFDVLDSDQSGHLSTDELVHGLMRLRGPIRKTEIVAIRLKMHLITERITRMMNMNAALVGPTNLR